MLTRLLRGLKALMGRRLPWWLVLLFGIACVVVGAVLTAEPFTSLRVLAALEAVALVVTGITQVTLPGVGHLATGHDAAPQEAQWVADGFTRAPAPTTCSA
jgi:hypothetical protein